MLVVLSILLVKTGQNVSQHQLWFGTARELMSCQPLSEAALDLVQTPVILLLQEVFSMVAVLDTKSHSELLEFLASEEASIPTQKGAGTFPTKYKLSLFELLEKNR